MEKKYQIIYADPPWKYSFSGTRSEKKDDYPTMNTKDICNLPIAKLADENCVLFMWIIFNRLEDALEVIKSWGFTYKSMAFTWVKKNKQSDSWFWGMGGWTRQNPEICLIATKGKPQRMSASVHSIIDTPIEKHSKKPEEVRRRIVQLCGDIPRIELFAREKKEGWDAWGNEVNNDINIVNNNRSFLVNLENSTFEINSKDNVVINSDPIVNWMIGKTLQEIKPWLLENKAKVKELTPL